MNIGHEALLIRELSGNHFPRLALIISSAELPVISFVAIRYYLRPTMLDAHIFHELVRFRRYPRRCDMHGPTGEL
jgi:hypothetical protein